MRPHAPFVVGTGSIQDVPAREPPRATTHVNIARCGPDPFRADGVCDAAEPARTVPTCVPEARHTARPHDHTMAYGGSALVRRRFRPSVELVQTGPDDARAWAHRAAPTRCLPPSSAHGPRRHCTRRRRRGAFEAHGAAAPSRQDRDAGVRCTSRTTLALPPAREPQALPHARVQLLTCAAGRRWPCRLHESRSRAAAHLRRTPFRRPSGCATSAPADPRGDGQVRDGARHG